jgi:multiple sugar transport system permease protein
MTAVQDAAVAGPVAQEPAGRRRDRSPVTAAKVARGVLLAALGLAFLLPFCWIVFASLDSQASFAIQLPHLTLQNFADIFGADNRLALWNSAYLSLLSTVIATAVAYLAAYVISRKQVPYTSAMMFAILFLSGLPINILVVPLFQMYTKLGWLSSMNATAAFLAVTSMPFMIWMLKNSIDDIPKDLEEAAWVEGSSLPRVLVRVVLPMSLPGICAAAIYGFVTTWGNFLVPMVLDSDPAHQTAPIVIYGFIGAASVRWGNIAAYSLAYSLPVLVLYFVMGRITRGNYATGGAVK